MAHAISWFQIAGPNGKALQKFYSNVFGWKLQDLPGGGDMKMVPPEKDGIAGGIGTSQNHQPSVAVYISVGSIDQYLAKADRAGGKMAMAKYELPGGTMGSVAGFTDPAGNWIGLWESPPQAAPKKKSSSAKKKAAAAKPKKKAKAGAKKKTKSKKR